MSSEVVYEEVDDDQEEARQVLMSLKKASSNLEEKIGNKRKGSGRGRDGDSSLNYSASYMRDRSRMDEDNKYFIWTSKTGETKLISALEQKLLAAEELVKKRRLEDKVSNVLFTSDLVHSMHGSRMCQTGNAEYPHTKTDSRPASRSVIEEKDEMTPPDEQVEEMGSPNPLAHLLNQSQEFEDYEPSLEDDMDMINYQDD